MTKITFVNNSQPAINATNLNQLQTNIENAFNKKVLWTNSMASTKFKSQTITLSSSDYDYLIIFVYRNYDQSQSRTLWTIVEKNKFTEIHYSDYMGEIRSWNREVEVSSNNKVKFGTATINGVTSDTNDGTLIPYKIIGCKY